MNVPWGLSQHGVRRGSLRRIEHGKLDVAGFRKLVEEACRFRRRSWEDSEQPERLPDSRTGSTRRDAGVTPRLRVARLLACAEDRPPVRCRSPLHVQPVSRIVERVDVMPSAGQLLVVPRLLAVIRLLEPAGDVRVVMRLVNRDDASRCVHDRTAPLTCAPNEPVVVARATDHERRHGVEQPFGEDEVVERRVAAQPATVESHLSELRTHRGIVQPRSCSDLDVAAFSDDEELAERGSSALDRRRKVVEQHDVGVQEAPQRPLRRRCHALERAVEAWCAAVVSRKPANVLGACSSSGLFHSLLVSDEHDLDVLAKREPALDRVPLDVSNVATKRLRHCEDRQHASEVTESHERLSDVRRALPYDGGGDQIELRMTTKAARVPARRPVSSASKHGRAGGDLPLHFFTIVLNGEPFIRAHLDVLRRLSFRWHWHVVEGVASLVHDTAWSVDAGGRIDPAVHAHGLSVDGTTAYLDEIADREPERISIYRKPSGELWDGKREMVSAPLPNIREECLLWQIDADELWTAEQIVSMRQLFLGDPDRTAAYYWCHYVPAPGAVIATRYNYAANPAVEWLRTWRYRPGDRWGAHEPPILLRPKRGGLVDLGKERPFLHDETEEAGAVFQHFAYATEAQVRFKETYYGYGGAVEKWRELRDAVRAANGPLRLGDYLPWVPDGTLVDDAARRRVPLLARERDDGSWSFTGGAADSEATAAHVRERVIVVDGVFFQHFMNSGIARVWRSLLREWLKTGFADRIVFLDRAGAGPRLAGLPTRSIPRWHGDLSAQDSLRLQRICDEEEAVLFVSTYYTTPIATPTLMLVYDLIPERLGLDMSDPTWEEKHLAIEHASAYACISDNTRRDLLELEPASRDKPAEVVLLGVDDFTVHPERDVAAFRAQHGLDRPYFLVVGERLGVDGYKNVSLVFRALRDWHEADAHELVCVGGRDTIEPELKRIAPRMRVRRLTLSDDELRLAYAGAVALLFPSRYEGFGLPVAEAMACGCPVITTPLSSLPEVAGDAAIYVDPDDVQSLQEAFDRVREPSRRAAMVAAGASRAARLTWAEAASAFAAALSAAASSDTVAQRRMREAVWRPRREAQNRTQQTQASRRTLEPDVQAQPPMRDRAAARLKVLARRYLPPWAVAFLLALRASTRRRLGRFRRTFAPR